MQWIKLDESTTTEDYFNQLLQLEATCGLEPFSEEMLQECIYYLDTYAWLDRDRIAGFITLQPATGRSSGGIYVVNLNVGSPYRRQGLGSSLMLTALAHYGGSHQGKTVVLDVAKTNLAAQKLYIKLGFAMTDLPSQNGPDDYVMIAKLDQLLGTRTTERLTVRPMVPEDADTLSSILNDPAVKATYMVPDLDTQATKQLALRIIQLCYDRMHYVRGIFLNHQLIGLLNDVDTFDQGLELGWVIAPAQHNKGYATEAVAAAIDDLFSKGYQRIIAGAFCENEASLRVMEKVGMHPITKTEEIAYRGQTHKCVYFERCKA